ncbi:MAG: glycine cleavage system aminomethyltransferase GcvT [Planctomycetota bacterium]
MQQTPIHSFHVEHGGQMVDYAGWELPIRYGSIADEHAQTRASGSVFDVSHMGRIELKGLHAKRLLERVCSRRIGTMQQGQCRYALVCNEQGGVRDDVIVMRMDEDDFLMVCNGANREKIVGHLESVVGERGLKATVTDKTLKTAMVALQGPKVVDLVSTVSKEVPALKRYRFTVKNLVIVKLIVARTGYTGEDGFEVILPAQAVPMAMKLLLKDVDPEDPNAVLKPAGLGARDTLRLEAGMPLYGHELGEDINALSCGVDFAINLDKNADEDGETFIGQEALVRTRNEGGPGTRLVGLRLEGSRTARQGMVVRAAGGHEGIVTSGCIAPTVGASIAMAFLPGGACEVGTAVEVETGRATIAGEVVPLPFYKKS